MHELWTRLEKAIRHRKEVLSTGIKQSNKNQIVSPPISTHGKRIQLYIKLNNKTLQDMGNAR